MIPHLRFEDSYCRLPFVLRYDLQLLTSVVTICYISDLFITFPTLFVVCSLPGLLLVVVLPFIYVTHRSPFQLLFHSYVSPFLHTVHCPFHWILRAAPFALHHALARIPRRYTGLHTTGCHTTVTGYLRHLRCGGDR